MPLPLFYRVVQVYQCYSKSPKFNATGIVRVRNTGDAIVIVLYVQSLLKNGMAVLVERFGLRQIGLYDSCGLCVFIRFER